MKLNSPAFSNHGSIPLKYTCDGSNISPPLRISGVPEDAGSLALMVEDPDATSGDFSHWLAYDIPVSIEGVPEDSTPGIVGRNDFNKSGYGGPSPISGSHRYNFKLFALDTRLGLPAGKTKAEVLAAMQGHIIDRTELTGLYQRTG